jgi:hypothetical protein
MMIPTATFSALKSELLVRFLFISLGKIRGRESGWLLIQPRNGEDLPKCIGREGRQIRVEAPLCIECGPRHDIVEDA